MSAVAQAIRTALLAHFDNQLMLTSASMPAVASSSFSLIEIVIHSQALRHQKDSSHQTQPCTVSNGTLSRELLSCSQAM